MPPARFDNLTDSRASRILLVGDQVSALRSVVETELDGVTVVSEPDVGRALDRIEADPTVGCVVVTHDPPSADGLAVLRTVREEFPTLPFVVRVVDGDESVVESILAAGATDIVDADSRWAEALLTRRVETALWTREPAGRPSGGVCVLDSQFRVVESDDDIAALLGREAPELADERAFEGVAAADGTPLHEVFQAVRAGEEPTTVEVAAPKSNRRFDVRIDPIDAGLRVVVEDHSGEDSDGRSLRVLHDAFDRLFAADSVEAVDERLEEAVTGLPSVTRATVYRFDDEENVLRPPSDDDRCAVGPADGSPLWDAFVEGQVVARRGDEDESDDSTPVVVAPLDEWGVLVVEPANAEWVDDDTLHRGLRTMVTAAVESLGRLDREETLQRRERELDRTTDRLDRVDRAIELLLDVETAVTGATSREELETAVCEGLAEREGFSFVWIGGLDEDGDALVPRAWSGAERGYLDAVDLSIGPDAEGPAARAARDRSVVRVPRVSHQLKGDSWRRELLNRGHNAVVSLPLVHGGSLYGVLTLCAGTPGAFDELEERVLGQIADSTAYGIDAIERQQALVVDSVVELEVSIEDSTDVLQRLARHVDGVVTFEGAVTTPGASSMLYVSVANASASAVVEFLRASVSVDDVDHVADREDGGLFVLTVSKPTLVTRVTRAGAAIQSLTARPTGTRLDVELPRPANVRGFLENLQDAHPEAELLTTHTYERPLTSRRTFLASLTDRLTDRQLEVLETAYRNGYFEWPRTRTGEEIASLLGITQPTFNNHLRVSERKLFSMLFDEGPQPGTKHT